MTGEDIDDGRLSDLGSTINHLLASPVEGLDVDDNIAVAHANMLDVRLKYVSWQDTETMTTNSASYLPLIVSI